MKRKKKETSDMKADSTLTNKKTDPGFLREAWHQVRMVFKLLRDPDVPFYLKVLPFAAVLYLLWPIDFISDIIPGLGQLDDITVLLVGAKVFIELAPPDVVMRHMNALREKDGFAPLEEGNLGDSIVIDGEVIIEKDPEDLDQ
jgi:uncharacterized membrane protein YkvA (DUF1232 family)